MLHSPARRPEGNQDTAEEAVSRHKDTPSRTESEARGPAAVDAVDSCKLPTFWRSRPELWFIRVENAFQLNRIRSDEGKFGLALDKLDDETLAEVEDVVRHPPASNRYGALKHAILSRLTDSAEQQLRHLFTRLELGDRRPSQLLRRMRGLAADRITDEALRVRWLDLLPASTQQLLQLVQAPTLEDLAAIADRISETPVGSAEVAATSRTAQSTVSSSSSLSGPAAESVSSLAAEVAALRADLAQIRRDSLRPSRYEEYESSRRCRCSSGSRERRSRPRSRGSSASRGLCFYHSRFGAQARNCRGPCTFRFRSPPGN